MELFPDYPTRVLPLRRWGSWRPGGLGLKLHHNMPERSIVCCTISTNVDTSMTVGAECNDVRRVIRSSVTQSAKMMWLQIRCAVFAGKQSSCTAALTVTACACQYITTYILASLINGALSLRA